MSRFLRVFAIIFGLFFTGNAFAAGYTCNDIKMYTSCNPGYYLTSTDVGNSCAACSDLGAGWTSDGGTTVGAAASCYKTITLNKNGFSGTLTANTGTGCKVASTVTGTTNGTLKVYYNTACTLPPMLVRYGAYVYDGWSTDNTIAATSIMSIDATTDASTLSTTLYARKSTCNANYYKRSTTTCSSCSTETSGAYPYSLMGTGGITSCYANVTLDKNGFSGTLTANTGTGCQVASTATGTTNGTLRVYYNTACTLPTISTALTQTGYTSSATWASANTVGSSAVTTIAASTSAPTITTYYVRKSTCASNYYKSSTTACSSCSTDTSGAYPYSAAGTGGITSCFANVTLNKNGFSGTLTAGTGTGCKVASTATGTTNGTLRVYYNTACTLPTISTALTQTGYIASTTWASANTVGSSAVTTIAASTSAPTITTYYVRKSACAANYYKSSTTACSSCSTGTSSAYPYSAQGTGDITSCYARVSLNKNGYSGTLTAGTGTGCKVDITATGTTAGILKVYYNTACTLPTISTALTQTGYTPSTTWASANTIGSSAVTTIAASTSAPTITRYYVQKPSCAQNYYKSNTTTCGACGANSSTSAGNTSTTCACALGYTGGTDAGSVNGSATTTSAACELVSDISCSAGYYLPKNTLTCNGTCTAGNWCAGGTFSFNASNNQGLSSCSGNLGTGYTSAGGTGDTANTKCYLPVSAGYVRSGTSGTTTTVCDAGKYKTAHNAYYGSSYSCSNVNAGYWNNGGGTSATPTAAGNGCLSSKACGKVDPGCYTTSTGSTSACPNECPGDMTSDAGSDAKTDCKITCTAGNYLAANTGVCATCTKGNYCANDGTYNFNASSNQGIAACSGANQWQANTGKTSCNSVTDGMYKSNNYTLENCGTGSYCKSGVKTACPNSGTTASATASLITSCYKTGLSLTVSNGAGTQRCFYTSGSGTSAIYDTSCDTKTVTKCDAKFYRANASDLTCTTVGTGHYSPADSLGRTQCPTADSGWTVTSPAGTTYSDCYETKTGSAISPYCNAGVLKRTASSASAYNTTATISTALKAIAGAYVNGQTCTYCPAGKYQATSGSTATSCSSSVNKGYYNTGCGTSATGGVCNTTNFSGGKVNAGCYADTTGSTSACPKTCPGLYVNSAAGSDAATDCYIITTAGKYMKLEDDLQDAADITAQTKCPIKQYCESETLYYPNVSVLNDGGWNDCPAVDGRILTTYPDDWYSPTSVTASLQPWSTGLTSKSACMANYTVVNPRGRFSIESVKYDEDADKYQNNLTGGKYYTKVNPGFYVLEQYSATRCDGTENANKTMIYKDAQPCPAGSYCPGYTSMPICSSGTYGTEMGKFSCSDNTSSNYPNSTAGSGNTAGATSVNSCYLTTTSGKFVKTANAAQETCTCGGYCPGSVMVRYGGTGGKTNCTAGTYNGDTGSSASSACKTTSAGYYAPAGSCSQTQVNANCWGGAGSKVACPNSCTSPYSTSAKGSDDANDCYLTTTAKNYVKTAGAGQTTCAAGTYCPGGSVIYKGGTVSGRNTTGGSTTCPAGSFCAAGVSAGTECVLGSYSAAGASACTACQDGKTTSTKGATSCNATCSNASGVSDWENASWATTNAMTNLCTIAASAGCSANYYKNNNACSTCSSGTGSKYTFSAAGTTSVNSCYLKTSTGKYVATKGAGETACISPYYCPGNITVYYGTGTTTGGNIPCTDIASIYNASDASASKQSQCFAKTSPGKYIKATGTSETTCPAGDYCLGGTTVYYGSAGGNTDCPSGYTNGTTGYSLESQCLMSVAGGKYVATAKESVASGTCDAGYAKPVHTVNYGGTSSCNPCTGATYQPDTGQASCISCPTYEAYSSKVLGKQYWTSSGVHDTKEGCQVRMNEPVADDTGDYDGKVYCSYSNTAGDYSSCWVYQQANSCIDGYYYAAGVGKNTSGTATTLKGKVCKPVESGFWSAADDLTRTACDTGLVTCGAGKCANEAADCGRILHAGNQSIYLRSAARTSPALNVKIGNQTFFGALSTSYSSGLKVKKDSTTYSVVNDYQ